jgi:hypothetical protein
MGGHLRWRPVVQRLGGRQKDQHGVLPSNGWIALRRILPAVKILLFVFSGTPMKRTRFGSRDRLSRDAAELQRLATGLSESGGKLEDSFWEGQLAELVDQPAEERCRGRHQYRPRPPVRGQPAPTTNSPT